MPSLRIEQLFSLPDYKDYRYIMSDRNTHEVKYLDIKNPLVRKEIRQLRIEDIYADCGVNIIVHFDKRIWKIYGQLVALYENNKEKFK